MSIITYTLQDLYPFIENKPDEIIKSGVLGHEHLLLISGQPKARKSFLTYNMGLSIAAGRPFARFEITNPHKVLVISAEGGALSNSSRLLKMQEGIGQNRDEKEKLDENFLISFTPKLWLNEKEDRQALLALVKSVMPEVLILDPLVRFHSLNENAANEMGFVFTVLRKLMTDYKLSVILVHHHGKTDENGARGSSAIMGEYDSSIKISNTKKKNEHRLSFDLRHSESPDDVLLNFNPESFWFESTETKEDEMIELLRKNGPMKRNEWVKLAQDEKLGGHSTLYGKIKILEENQLVAMVDGLYQVN